jgi:hypothetical protein
MCPRCAADPQPANFGSPRKCAFDEQGHFTPDNWNCATLSALFGFAEPETVQAFTGDEMVEVIPTLLDGEACERPQDRYEMEPGDDLDTGGFFVFTRYKRRGCTSAAVHVGDFWPPARVTLAKVLASLQRYEALYPEVGRRLLPDEQTHALGAGEQTRTPSGPQAPTEFTLYFPVSSGPQE